MDITVIKDWLVPVSSSFALVSTAVGIWIALGDYRLKLQAETRLSHSSQVEADIHLLKIFTEIMTLAHGRGLTLLSEKAVEFLLKDRTLSEVTKDGRQLRDVICDGAVLSLPVGGAAQGAAIAAIATLGRRHDILREASIQALESIATFKKEIAEKYLVELNRDAKPGA
jgi:hypothetical protein